MRSDPPLSQERLDAAIAVVTSGLSGDLSTRHLALATGLSEFHFSRAFRKSTGQSPYAYVITRRMEAAKELLRDTDMSIAKVASSVGYCTQAHFTGAFRQRTGTTPKVFRDEARRARVQLARGVLAVTHTVPLEKRPDMYKAFKQKDDGCIKVVIKS